MAHVSAPKEWPIAGWTAVRAGSTLVGVSSTPQPEVSGFGTAPLEIIVIEADAADRHGAELVLKSWGHRLIGRAGSSAEAFAVIAQRRPQVALVGVRLPDGSGIQLVRRLLAADPGLGVVLVLGEPSASELEEAMACGARGIVQTRCEVAELASVVSIVGAGGRYVAPGVERRARALARPTMLFGCVREGLVLLSGRHEANTGGD
jgi:DNA-binding NarL/FixJ family response regulator